MKLGRVVWFSTHLKPFLIRDNYCSNLDCCCNEVHLRFTEVSETGGARITSLTFSIRVNLQTWQESEPPQRSPEVADWVREFVKQCPMDLRNQFQASYDEHRRIAKRKAEYRLDVNDVNNGIFVAYADILKEKSALSSGGNSYSYDVDYHGREFVVVDQYCPNPRCNCQSVSLIFFEITSQRDGTRRPERRFLARMTFAGELPIDDRMACPLDEAEALLSAWWQMYAEDDLQLLRDRYAEVKEIGQRSLQAQTPRIFATRPNVTRHQTKVMPEDLATSNVKLRRNAICVCGSGKKFKKCCGRKSQSGELNVGRSRLPTSYPGDKS